MQLLADRYKALTAIAALWYSLDVILASTTTQSVVVSVPFVPTTVTSTPIGTCEARTINYITHSLPQVCLRYPRRDPTNSESANATATDEAIPSSSETAKSSLERGILLDDPGKIGSDVDADSALDDSTFLSFEEWKKRTLEREGLLDPNTGERRAQPPKDGEKRRSSDGIQEALKALEEDVNIDPDFRAFLGERTGDSQLKTQQREDRHTEERSQDTSDDSMGDQSRNSRSADAGKTSKERFNFASLDAGGQIMKTNPEAKSASGLLKEDRDVYMLNECHAKDKFLIVELSESILVETVAIANFEFFSSTFKDFRVSVSDRFSTKPDRWVDLGTFEARNSRDIQAFLIDDPRIWARYLRLDFLSHYGNEFYCPVSLLRVHGRTMIQDILGMEEVNRVEDDNEDNPEHLREAGDGKLVRKDSTDVLGDEIRVTQGLKEAQAALEELVDAAEAITSSHGKDPPNSSQIIEVGQWLENISMEQTTTPWIKEESALGQLIKVLHSSDLCFPADAPASLATDDLGRLNDSPSLDRSDQQHKAGVLPDDAGTMSGSPEAVGGGVKEAIETDKPVKAYSLQPSIQESFFKTVTKRLQLLEANSTLSLKYIEEQSRSLRDAFMKVEKRQLAKTTSFLENLNDTVLEELRKFGQQYDQIWQSTVIELETQRDQSQREIAAVSTRLSMLADEVVYQKRMSIVQSLLLLICLGLVIFSRSSSNGYLDIPAIQSMIARSRNVSDIPGNSGQSSAPPNPSLRGRSWLGPEHRRQRSDETAGSFRTASREYSPPTPFSSYSGQEEDSKPSDQNNDLLQGVRTSLMGAPTTKPDEISDGGGLKSSNWKDPEPIPEEDEYPDFRNSALWLTTNSGIRDQIQLASSEEPPNTTKSGAADEISNGGRRSSQHGMIGTPNLPQLTMEPHMSPSASESQRNGFSIARKPLPALPKDA